MSSWIHNFIAPFGFAFALALAVYGIVVRGRTPQERQRQQGYMLFGLGLAALNSTLDRLRLPEAVQIGLGLTGVALVLVGLFQVATARGFRD